MAVVVPALVVLLIATTSFSTTTTAARGSNRTPRLVEPLSAGGYRAYIVFLHFLPADQAPAGGGGLADMHDAAAHAAWHASFLPSTKTTDGRPRLLFSYSALGGFSALLTDDEAEVLAGKPGVSVVIPNGYRYQRTTRTPDFLGLATGGDSSVWDSSAERTLSTVGSCRKTKPTDTAPTPPPQRRGIESPACPSTTRASPTAQRRGIESQTRRTTPTGDIAGRAAQLIIGKFAGA